MGNTKFADFLKKKIKENARMENELPEVTLTTLKGHIEIDLVNHLEKQSYIRFDPTAGTHQIKMLSNKTYLCLPKKYYEVTKNWLESNGFVLNIYASCLENLFSISGELVGEISFKEN